MDDVAVPKTISTMSDNNIQVFIRIRPPSNEEPSYSRVVEVNHTETQIVLKQGETPRVFNFDYVADVDARQETIFNNLGKKVIENCIAGYNGTIFAYGQTGSGKTYTMMGPSEDIDNNFQDELRGVIPRSFEYLFALIKREKELHGENKQFLCKCSFLEIYNEQIFDLLEPSPQILHLRESLKNGVYVAGLSEQIVVDASEAYQLLSSSWMNRRVASTSMNRESSRSHAVFTLIVESKEMKGGSEHIKTSQLNLVDLAGSESPKNTNASGMRLKEAGSINKSLSNLGNVIMCLVSVSRDGKERHVPYRDSKLTFLLRASLGGNSKTSLIACVHSGHKYYAETISTIQFAKRAKMIKNKAVLNENAHVNIQQLQLEIKKLKEELSQYKSGAVIPQEPSMAPQEPAEPTPLLKIMFLEAMNFYQKAQMDKMAIENELTEHKRIADRNVRQKVMIIKFREEALKRYEGKKKGIESEDKTVESLQEEIKVLRDQNDNHPLVAKYSRELQKLRIEIQSMKNSDDWLAKVDAKDRVSQDLERKYKELVAEKKVLEDEPLSTPSGSDSISTATLEKLRSQNKDLEEENKVLKQTMNDSKEEFEQEVKKLSTELKCSENTIKDLEIVIAANDTRNKIEMANITEKHLQTVITITTPKKEKGKPKCAESPLHSTFYEQIKEQQDVIANLEMRISEYDRDRIQNVQTNTVLESRLVQMEELLEKEKEKELATRQKLTEVENRKDGDMEQILRDKEEIADLRMVLNSADKELKDLKMKYKAADASMLSDKEKYSTRLEKLERSLELLEKERVTVVDESEALRINLEVQKDTADFHENLCRELEEKLTVKEDELKQLANQLKETVERLNEERSHHENKSNQLSSEGLKKEQLYLDQCAANKELEKEKDELKDQVHKHRESEELVSKMYKQSLDKIHQFHIKIEEMTNTDLELEQVIQGQLEELQIAKKFESKVYELEKEKDELYEEIKELKESNSVDKQKQDANMDMLQQDLSALQDMNNEYSSENDILQERVKVLENAEEELRKEHESFRQRTEESNVQLSTQDKQLQEASCKIKDMSDSIRSKIGEIDALKMSADGLMKERKDALSQEKELRFEIQELKECIERQAEAIDDHMKMLSQAESKADAFTDDCKEKTKELTNLHQELERLQHDVLTKEDLEKDVIRLTHLAKNDNDEKMSLKAELSRYKNEVKKMYGLFHPDQDVDTDFFEQQRKDQSSLDLSIREAQYHDASFMVKDLSSLILSSKEENTALKLSLDELQKERNRALSHLEELTTRHEQMSERLERLQRAVKENQDLERDVERLTELAKMENVEKLNFEAELTHHKHELKKIHGLFQDEQDPNATDVEFIHDRIKSLKTEKEKILEENSVLIGHSNHKQKIKYHEQVKNENLQLKRDNAILQVKSRHLQEQLSKYEKDEKANPLGELKENTRPL